MGGPQKEIGGPQKEMGGPQKEIGGLQKALGGIEDKEIRPYARLKPLVVGRKDKWLWMDRLNCTAEMASI